MTEELMQNFVCQFFFIDMFAKDLLHDAIDIVCFKGILFMSIDASRPKIKNKRVAHHNLRIIHLLRKMLK